MRVFIWTLLVIAVIAVVREFYKPAVPETELIAGVSNAYLPVTQVNPNRKNLKPTDLASGETLDEDALPDSPSSPVVQADVVSDDVSDIPDNAVLYKLSNNKVLKWIGRKVGGEHNGVINILSGDIYVVDGTTIVGGDLVFDMSTIHATDINNQSLDNQLKGEEYFNAEKYPTSVFEFIGYKDGKITGLLTIKDVTKQIDFPASISIEDDIVVADAKFAIDRTEWGVKGGLPAVSQYMELSFSLVWQP